MAILTWEELEAEYSAMYDRIETNDEGDITMKKVVEHIKGVEAGSGKNEWVVYIVNKFFKFIFHFFLGKQKT